MFKKSPEMSRRRRLDHIQTATKEAIDFVLEHLPHAKDEDIVVPIGKAPKNTAPEFIIDTVGKRVIDSLESKAVGSYEYSPVKSVTENTVGTENIPHDQELAIVLSPRDQLT